MKLSKLIFSFLLLILSFLNIDGNKKIEADSKDISQVTRTEVMNCGTTGGA